MRVVFAAAVLAGLAAMPAMAEESVSGPASAQVVAGDSPTLRSVSRSFELKNLYVPDGKTRWFVIETETTRQDALIDSDDGVPTGRQIVSLREVVAGAIGPVTTRLSVDAHAVKIDRMPLLEVENWGCCVQSNTLRSYDLLTGRLISVRSSDLALPTFTRTGNPAVGWRVEVFRGVEPLGTEMLGSDPTAFGLITLIREDVPVQQVVLRFATDKDGDANTPVDWTNEIGWVAQGKGTLTDHFVLKPEETSTMSLVWTLDEKTRIAIPFTGEKLDVAHAALPAKIVAADRKVE
jgi:hypothetical protein